MVKRQETNIYTVAKEAGVSIATVSRVINQSASVNEKSRKKVLDAIEKLNYVPNQLARSLSTSTFDGVAVVVPDVSDSFFVQLLKGITQAADQVGCNVLLFDSNNELAREHRILDSLRELRLRGIIIVAVSYADWVTIQKLKDFESFGTLVVVLDRELISGDFDCVISSDEKGSFQAVTELIRQGHRKIGLIAGPESVFSVFKRLNGYYQAMRAAGIAVREEYVRIGEFTVESGCREMEALLALPDPPTAVFPLNGSITYGCLKALSRANKAVGRDVSMICFDDVEELKWLRCNISAVSRDVMGMGRLAMEQLARRMNAEKIEDRLVAEVPAELILRGSERFPTGKTG